MSGNQHEMKNIVLEMVEDVPGKPLRIDELQRCEIALLSLATMVS
jgi:hypothetical protein